MPTIAFWNLGKQKHLELIVDLIGSMGIEILVLAEQKFSSAELILAYSKRFKKALFELSVVPPSRVRFYSILPNTRFRSVADEPYLSIKEYKPLVGTSILIVGVHLPSKIYERPEDQASNARRVAMRIEEAEILVGHDRTLVIGDFNMDPFEVGMVDSDCMHGVMDRRTAEKSSRWVKGRERRYFYNPMWKLMGDNAAQALGTYYFSAKTFISYFWHTFDQALLRPALLTGFREDSLHVIQKVGKVSLLAKRGPGIDGKFSDHLPVMLELNI